MTVSTIILQENPRHATSTNFAVLCLQLVLMASGIVDELEAASRAKDKDKARKAANRMRNLRALVSMAGLADLQKEAEPLLFDLAEEGEEEDGERLDVDLSSSSSTGSSRSILAPAGKAQASASSSSSGSGDTDSIGLLQHFVDYCSLQGDGDGEEAQQTSRVQFMTMHSSKGKEFGCVVTMSFYEGVLPSDRSKDPEELEQERNTAYVAVTRAKDKLLIIWPSSTGAPGQWSFRSTTVSRYLKEAVHLAQQGKLQGVQYTELKSDQ
jgi:superfamily I DNA/RNA helicase